MRRLLAIGVGVAMGVAIVLAQSADWRHWQYAAPVSVPPGTPAGLVGVVMTPDLAGRARADWADLRVVDDTAREVPFVIRERHAQRRYEPRVGRLLDEGWVPGQYSQAVVDLGRGAPVHNRVDVVLVDAGDMASWMEVASSPDGRAWTVVRDRAPIYSLHQAGFGEWLQATYPESTAQFVRVRILDGTRRFDVRGASVLHEVDTAPELTPAPVTFAAAAPTAPDRSVYVSSPATPGLNIGELRFETPDTLFDRPVLVEASDDGRDWARAMESQIFRTESPAAAESMSVRVDTTSAAYWRVTIYNRSDRPLGDLHITPFELPRRVVFRYDAGRTYRLLVGNSRTGAPQYDLARTVSAETLDAAAAAGVGASAAQADFADPRPWTEQHPVVLWGAVGLAVVVLGGLAVRTLRHP